MVVCQSFNQHVHNCIYIHSSELLLEGVNLSTVVHYNGLTIVMSSLSPAWTKEQVVEQPFKFH